MNTVSLNKTIKGMQAITKSDADTVDKKFNEGLYITVAGTVNVEFIDGTTFIIPAAVAANTTFLHNLEFNKILSTSTTATGIYGLKYQP